MDMRMYDPAIARWVVQDLVVHFDYSTYSALDNNPVFWADPSGADSEYYEGAVAQSVFQQIKDNINSEEEEEDNRDDNITVNKAGKVTKVEKNDQPNRFFDEDGNELFFHDAGGVDGQYIKGTWRIGDRVYYPISYEKMFAAILSSGLISQRLISEYAGPNSGGYYIWSLFSAYRKGHGGYDFAEGFLANQMDYKTYNTSGGRARATYSDGAGFFRFGNSTNIYNLYDGGNFMWGKAMRMSGFSYWEVKHGSQLNEAYGDSEADQRAIKNGYYGN